MREDANGKPIPLTPGTKQFKQLKGGHPPAKIDKDVVLQLARIGCTYEEIAAVTGVNKSTIYRRFKSTITEGHADMRKSIRRKQMEVALKDGHAGMLMWLGKQVLGQSEQKHVQLDATITAIPSIAIEFINDESDIIEGEFIEVDNDDDPKE